MKEGRNEEMKKEMKEGRKKFNDLRPSMKFRVLFYLFIGIQTFAFGQKFAHQVYLLSDHFSKASCEVDAACDCCASELIFLTKRKFALIDRCLNNDTYLKGTYSSKKEKLTLRFKPKVVSNLIDEKSEKEHNEIKTIKMSPLVLQISPCGKDKIILEHPTIQEYKYGSRQASPKEKQITRQMKQSEAWKLL